jgi:WD40 repeat protein
MKSKKRPYFRLEKIYADGFREAPEIYRIEELNGDWRMGRRGFLGTSAVSAAAMGSLLGCSGNEETSENAVGGKCQTDALAHPGGVNSIAYSPDGKFLASGGNDGKVKLWEMPSGRLAKTWGEPGGSVDSVCFNPGGNQIASASSENIKIRNASSGELLEDLKTQSHIKFMALGSAGRLLISNPFDYEHILKAWKLPSRNPVDIYKWAVTALASSPDGKTFATAHHESIKIWDAESLKIKGELGLGLFTELFEKLHFQALAISPDEKYLAASEQNEIHIWDLSTRKIVRTLKGHEKTLKGNENSFQTVAFSPSAEWITAGACRVVGGTRDYVEIDVELWGVSTGKRVKTLLRTLEEKQVQVGPSKASACFSPDGTHLAVGFADGTIRMWELPSGKQDACLSDPSADSRSTPSEGPESSHSGGVMWICTCKSICTCVPIK